MLLIANTHVTHPMCSMRCTMSSSSSSVSTCDSREHMASTNSSVETYDVDVDVVGVSRWGINH